MWEHPANSEWWKILNEKIVENNKAVKVRTLEVSL